MKNYKHMISLHAPMVLLNNMSKICQLNSPIKSLGYQFLAHVKIIPKKSLMMYLCTCEIIFRKFR